MNLFIVVRSDVGDLKDFWYQHTTIITGHGMPERFQGRAQWTKEIMVSIIRERSTLEYSHLKLTIWVI